MSKIPTRVEYLHHCLSEAMLRTHNLCHMRSHDFMFYLLNAAKNDDCPEARALYADLGCKVVSVIRAKKRFTTGVSQDLWSDLYYRKCRLEKEWGMI